jgi:hypothetical protein
MSGREHATHDDGAAPPDPAASECPYCGEVTEAIGSCKILCRRCRRVIGTCGD